MKTLTNIVLGFILVISAQVSSGQTPRRADNVKHFIITALEPFDRWPPYGDSVQMSHQHQDFGPMGDETYRYLKLDTGIVLGFNTEMRGFWDIINQAPAPPSIVVGGSTLNNMYGVIL